MSSHYLFTLWDGSGTVPPELSLAGALIERGHRVTVLADPTIEPEAMAAGADFRSWRKAPHLRSRRPRDDYLRDFEVDNPPELIARLCERLICGPASAYAAETASALNNLRPDAVVSSAFLLGPQIATEAAGLPWPPCSPTSTRCPPRACRPSGRASPRPVTTTSARCMPRSGRRGGLCGMRISRR